MIIRSVGRDNILLLEICVLINLCVVVARLKDEILTGQCVVDFLAWKISRFVAKSSSLIKDRGQ